MQLLSICRIVCRTKILLTLKVRFHMRLHFSTLHWIPEKKYCFSLRTLGCISDPFRTVGGLRMAGSVQLFCNQSRQQQCHAFFLWCIWNRGWLNCGKCIKWWSVCLIFSFPSTVHISHWHNPIIFCVCVFYLHKYNLTLSRDISKILLMFAVLVYVG